MTKLAVVSTGYVGMSMAVLLADAQRHALFKQNGYTVNVNVSVE